MKSRRDLREFVRVMESGSDEEQRAAVNAAGERVLRRIGTLGY